MKPIIAITLVKKNDDNVLCWYSREAINKFYNTAIKALSVMRIPKLRPRCAVLYMHYMQMNLL